MPALTILAATMVLLAVGLAFLALSASRPVLLLATLLPTQALLGGTERGLIVPGLRLSEVLLAAVLIGLVLSPRWSLERLRGHGLNPWLILYLVTCCVVPILSWVVRGNGLSPSVVRSYAGVLKAVGIYVAVVPLALSRKDLVDVFALAVAAMGVSAIVALLQYVDVAPVVALLRAFFKSPHQYLVLEGRYHRATGLLGNWHGLGLSFVLGVSLVGFLWHNELRWSRNTVVIVVLILAIGILSTATFMSLGLLILTGAMFALQGRGHVPVTKLILWGTVVALTVGAFVATGLFGGMFGSRFTRFTGFLPESVYGRLYAWIFLYGPIIVENPVVGYGPFLPNVDSGSDDSQFVGFLLRGGIISLVGWVLAMYGILRWAWGQATDAEDGSVQRMARVVVWSSIVMLMASVLQSAFAYTGVADVYWVIVAVSVSLTANLAPPRSQSLVEREARRLGPETIEPL